MRHVMSQAGVLSQFQDIPSFECTEPRYAKREIKRKRQIPTALQSCH